MPAPYDYLGNVPQPNIAPAIAGIGEALGGGILAAAKVQAAQRAQQEQQQALLAQQQAAAQRRIDFQNDVDAMAKQPDMVEENFARLSAKYPDMMEPLKAAHSSLSDERKSAIISSTAPLISAIQSKDPELISSVFDEREKALQNSISSDPSNQKAVAELNRLRLIRAQAEKNPDSAVRSLLPGLIAATGEKDFASTYKGLLEGAGVQVISDQKALQALIDTGLYERFKKAGIFHEEAQAKALSSDSAAKMLLAKTDENYKNWLMTQDPKAKLEYEKAAKEFADKIAEKKSVYDKAVSDFDMTRNTISLIQSTPAEIRERAHGPGLQGEANRPLSLQSQQVADYAALVKQLSSRNFITSIAGLGSMAGLSEKEGEKLQTALGNLTFDQSVQSIDRSINMLSAYMDKAQKIMEEKYNAQAIPLGGAQIQLPQPPPGAVSPPPGVFDTDF